MTRDQATATALLAGNGLCLLKLADVITDPTFQTPERFEFSLATLVLLAGIGTFCSFVLYQSAYDDHAQDPGSSVFFFACVGPLSVWLALLSLASLTQ